MKKRKNKPGWIIFTLALLLSWGTTHAQISFSVSNKIPKYIDLAPVFESHTSNIITKQFVQWLNYTTLVEYHEPAFTVSLQMRSKKIPAGLKLEAHTEPYKGLIKGEEGTVVGKIQVSQTARALVNNITTCYTGSGRGEGHKINLIFRIPIRDKKITSSNTITLVYTLTQ